jgi:SAM-dependent methyltransferase
MLESFTYRVRQKLKEVIRFNKVQEQLSELERKTVYEHIQQMDQRIARLEGRPSLKEAWAALNDRYPRPTLENPVSQAATADQFREPCYQTWCRRLKDQPRFHRKQWEHVYILQALDKAQMLQPGKRGVGFGIGREAIPDLMASLGVSALVTDLDLERAQQSGWAGTHQHSNKSADLRFRGISTRRQFFKHIEFSNVDMNHIPSEISGFDFTWSSCAFEHLGSIDLGLQFVKNSLKTLKPGGVAVHTTELNVGSNDETLLTGPTVLFRRQDFEKLEKELKAEGHQLNLNFWLGDEPLDQFYDIAPYSENVHLKLKLENFVTTSFGLIVQKGGQG